jgi:hypothetical protein
MPPIINEQTDELKARRQRRKGRQEPPAVNGGTPAGGQSAGAARDLLRGLITDGAPRNEEGSAASGPGSESKPAVSASGEREDRTASESAPTTSRGGEAIDELIRRVKDNAAGAAVEASSTLEQRRPKGTADLARDAATSRAATRRRAPETELRSTDVAPTPKKHRRAVAAVVLLAGIAVLLVTLVGTGGTSGPRRPESSIASSRLAATRSGDFGGALQATIAAIAPELRAVARLAASSARAAANRHGAKRRQNPSRARHARSKHHAAVVHRAAVTNSSPPSTTGTQTQTSTAAQAPASTASQTSATSQPSATSSSRPAGPTGSNPLGGIGSCVKGC